MIEPPRVACRRMDREPDKEQQASRVRCPKRVVSAPDSAVSSRERNADPLQRLRFVSTCNDSSTTGLVGCYALHVIVEVSIRERRTAQVLGAAQCLADGREQLRPMEWLG